MKCHRKNKDKRPPCILIAVPDCARLVSKGKICPGVGGKLTCTLRARLEWGWWHQRELEQPPCS